MKKLNDNLIKVTSILSSDAYHDGTSIGAELNISRTAVWKIIKKLESYDITIQSQKGKGYALKEPLTLLDENKIQQQINSDIKVEIFEQLDSTINYLEAIKDHNKKTACCAETMTKGRGRFNRQWYAPFAQNINLSILFPIQKDMSELAGLSLIAGIAVCKAIENCVTLPEKLKLKWPNDVYYQGKKLAGISVHTMAESNGFCHAIISVGLNVNMLDAPKSIVNQPWTSLRKITGEYQNRNIICTAVINQMTNEVEKFIGSGFSQFKNDWSERDFLAYQHIKLNSAQHIFEGIGHGVNDRGHLLIKLADDSIKEFSSGDTTIIKR